ncbi:MAG TPA: hypothetical protein VFO65_03410 [Acidimicrobiales bacterium]|nr:hypothetical protein [Acidimicrobiales bacterium]
MATYVVRVWVPDRPGALGSVASRIGAVRGDLVGIDILERGAGLAIDELVVQLPDDENLVPLLLHEIGEVDGVAVEDIHKVKGGLPPDPRLAALETAGVLVEQRTQDDLLHALATHAAHDFGAGWATVLGEEEPVVRAAVGACPPVPWTTAFMAGSRTVDTDLLAGSGGGPEDMGWARLERARLDLVLGRPGRPIRSRERQQLAALVRVADVRWEELSPAGRSAAGRSR